jgi:hypothetical protein
VDEVWGLRRPDKRQLEQTGANARLITVEKSRAGRDGSKLLLKLESDLTFSLADYVEIDLESASPASIVDRVLQRLRAAHPRAITRSELAADPLCGGKVAAIHKALQRLTSRGLVEVVGTQATGARPSNLYLAVLSRPRDMCVKECPILEKPSGGLESKSGQPSEVSEFERATGAPPAANQDSPTPCPDSLRSHTSGSADVGQVSPIPPKTERTSAELEALKRAAADAWS